MGIGMMTEMQRPHVPFGHEPAQVATRSFRQRVVAAYPLGVKSSIGLWCRKASTDLPNSPFHPCCDQIFSALCGRSFEQYLTAGGPRLESSWHGRTTERKRRKPGESWAGVSRDHSEQGPRPGEIATPTMGRRPS